MAFRSDCSLSTAAVCWHDAPAMAPSARTFGLVGATWDFCWLGSGCRLGFSDAWVSNAIARRRLDASEAPRKDPLGVRKRECGLGARRPAVHARRPFLTKLYFAGDWVTGPLWRVLLLAKFCD